MITMHFQNKICPECNKREKQPGMNVCAICAGELLKKQEQQKVIKMEDKKLVKPDIIYPTLEDKCFKCGKKADVLYGGNHYCVEDLFRFSKAMRKFVIQLGKMRHSTGRDVYYKKAVKNYVQESKTSVELKLRILSNIGILKKKMEYGGKTYFTDLKVPIEIVGILKEYEAGEKNEKEVNSSIKKVKEYDKLVNKLAGIKLKLEEAEKEKKELYLKNQELKETLGQCKSMLERKAKQDNEDDMEVLKLKAEIYDLRSEHGT